MIRFTRHEPNEDGTYETLTLVRLDSDGSLAIQIETGTPDSWKRDPNDRSFVGLYDLDGDALNVGNESWEIVNDLVFRGGDAATLIHVLGAEETGGVGGVDVPANNAREALMRAWESGTTVCEAA